MNRFRFFLFFFLILFTSPIVSASPYASQKEVLWTCDLVYKFHWLCTSILDYEFPLLPSLKEKYPLIEQKKILQERFEQTYGVYEPDLHEYEELILPQCVTQEDLHDFLSVFHTIIGALFKAVNLHPKIRIVKPTDSTLKLLETIEFALSDLIDFSLDLKKITTDDPEAPLKSSRGETLYKFAFDATVWLLKARTLFHSFFEKIMGRNEAPQPEADDNNPPPFILNEDQRTLAHYEVVTRRVKLFSEGADLLDRILDLYVEYKRRENEKLKTQHSFIIEKEKLLRRRKIDEKKQDGFNTIIGRDQAKNAMHHIVSYLQKPLKFERENVRPPRAILIYGPSGAGKTWFIKALQKEAQCKLVEVNVRKSGTKNTDLATLLTQKFYEAQENAPAILFIDEADRFLGKKREQNTSLVPAYSLAQKQFNELVNHLEKQSLWSPPVVIILATNKPDDLDEDHLERCTLKIGGLEHMSEHERYIYLQTLFKKEIETSCADEISDFTLHFETMNVDVLLKKMAKETKQLLPRQISDFVEEARRTAIANSSYSIDEDCLRKALATINQSIKSCKNVG